MDYRLFFMRDGHVQGAVEFCAVADPAAIAEAERVRTGRGAELWNRARRVLAFTPVESVEVRRIPGVGDQLAADSGPGHERTKA